LKCRESSASEGPQKTFFFGKEDQDEEIGIKKGNFWLERKRGKTI